MTKLITFSGLHRTGKTTLMNSLKDELEELGHTVEIIKFSVSDIFKAHNLKTYEFITYVERLRIQTILLQEWKSIVYSHLKQSKADYAIVDRTPICFVGYTITNCLHDFPLDLTDEYLQFVEDCKSTMLSIENDSLNILLGPFKVEHTQTGRTGSTNKAYMLHTQYAMSGIFNDFKNSIPLESAEDKFFDLSRYTTVKSRVYHTLSKAL